MTEWINKLTLKDEFHTAFDRPWTLFSSENNLCIYLWKDKYVWGCIITSLILYLYCEYKNYKREYLSQYQSW